MGKGRNNLEGFWDAEEKSEINIVVLDLENYRTDDGKHGCILMELEGDSCFEKCSKKNKNCSSIRIDYIKNIEKYWLKKNRTPTRTLKNIHWVYYYICNCGNVLYIHPYPANDYYRLLELKNIYKNEQTKSRKKPYIHYEYLFSDFLGGGQIKIGAHIITALAFVPNDDPVNKNIVHHIDHNTENRSYKNLEWVSHSRNVNSSIESDMFNNFINSISIQKEIFKRLFYNGYKKDEIEKFLNALQYKK